CLAGALEGRLSGNGSTWAGDGFWGSHCDQMSLELKRTGAQLDLVMDEFKVGDMSYNWAPLSFELRCHELWCDDQTTGRVEQGSVNFTMKRPDNSQWSLNLVLENGRLKLRATESGVVYQMSIEGTLDLVKTGIIR